MKRIVVLSRVMKATGMWKIVDGFIAFLLLASLGIYFIEPGINSYRDALWFLFASFTTIGYGDIVATTTLGRIITIVVSLYGILVVAFIPAVIISYFTELTNLDNSIYNSELYEKMEHLEDLDKTELAEISKYIREMKKQIPRNKKSHTKV